ncbi:unnamed protein product [Cuscuta europaea]|uniref:Uncharacterized protein n=1 Tax=Cuscuta europaea TaxID=41803 RepID=A0A9P0YX13_CUSEU|nr:unnamed protein product [Cuscuta europaea]
MPYVQAPILHHPSPSQSPSLPFRTPSSRSLSRSEAEKFKEIARLSTHSILEACGLEARRPGIPSFPNSNMCIHVEGGREIRRSTLMPKSCRECFYLFVKDVVNTILSERKG